jgi:hypothetical protein
VTALNVNTDDVAPEIGSVSLCHWNVIGAEPSTVALSVTASPM